MHFCWAQQSPWAMDLLALIACSPPPRDLSRRRLRSSGAPPNPSGCFAAPRTPAMRRAGQALQCATACRCS
ncbi:hypothetical protein SEVIR_5G077501v4 [Setaria viridis]|uniref:Uncharacterized protein n=1 Tax=Setaria viridis TaxID=4556 RepID=A0A4U6UB46_SETVI|nr:hypothetical protein SEVIR_5G077501v2 [Setaria viridis]